MAQVCPETSPQSDVNRRLKNTFGFAVFSLRMNHFVPMVISRAPFLVTISNSRCKKIKQR